MLNPNSPATTRQTFGIFCRTGYDVRACNLTKAQASAIIDGSADVSTLTGAVKKKDVAGAQTAKPRADFPAIYAEAKAAGIAAGNAAQCVPMHVVQRANMLDDSSPIVKRYEPVMDGCCGFASVLIRPATSGFAKWLKTKGLGSIAYRGGLSLWIGEHNQSLTRKEAHAGAMVAVFAKYGFEARVDSRMD